jgi:hypothetical protein
MKAMLVTKAMLVVKAMLVMMATIVVAARMVGVAGVEARGSDIGQWVVTEEGNQETDHGAAKHTGVAVLPVQTTTWSVNTQTPHTVSWFQCTLWTV